jgi:hypothetical protein
MAGVVKVILTIVALVDGEHSMEAQAKDIIENAQQHFAPDQVKVDKVEFSVPNEIGVPSSLRETKA